MKRIDGNILEGGGQILRMSVAFSSLLNIPIKIDQIRAGRSKPGLKAQHMTGIKLIQKISNAQVQNCDLNSTSIEFIPTIIPKDNEVLEFSADIGTAGAITLLCQISLPCLLFASTESEIYLHLKGGTNVGMAPQIEYYNYVFKPNLHRFGVSFIVDEGNMRKGFFPKGGGSIKVKIPPRRQRHLNPINLEDPGDISKITIFSSVSGVLPIKMAHEMVKGVKNVLMNEMPNFDKINFVVDVKKEQNAFGNGSSIVIVAETTTGCILGGSGLGSPKEQAFSVGEMAAKELLHSVLSKGKLINKIIPFIFVRFIQHIKDIRYIIHFIS